MADPMEDRNPWTTPWWGRPMARPHALPMHGSTPCTSRAEARHQVTSGQELVRSADRLRQFLQHPSRLWTIRDDPEEAILQAARTVDRDAAAYFDDAALLAAALTESAVTADGEACRWCHAYQRVGQGAPMPQVNEATLRLLGDCCGRCSKVNLGRVLRALDEEMAAGA
jgi:hypothetical protein